MKGLFDGTESCNVRRCTMRSVQKPFIESHIILLIEHLREGESRGKDHACYM
jgi:hypothetical protein